MDEASRIVAGMRADIDRLAGEATGRSREAIRVAMMAAIDEIGTAGAWSSASAISIVSQLRQALMMVLAAQAGPIFLAAAVAVSKAAADRQVALLRALDRRFTGSVRPLNFDALLWAEKQGDRLGRLRLPFVQSATLRYSAAVVADIERAVTANALLGRPWWDAEKMLRKGTAAAISDQQWRIDRIMRTETAAIYNGAMLASMEAEDVPGDPMLKRLSATFDRVTGVDSVAAHGQIRRVGEPFQDIRGRLYQAPPNRPHDREIVLPHRASWGPTPPSLEGPRPQGAGRRRGEDSPETLAASAELTRLAGDVNDLRRRAQVGDKTSKLLTLARRRMAEGQVVLAANRVRDRVADGAGVRARPGITVSMGGLGARVRSVQDGVAVLDVGGSPLRVRLDARGRLLGASPGAGQIEVAREQREQALSMLRVVLSGR